MTSATTNPHRIARGVNSVRPAGFEPDAGLSSPCVRQSTSATAFFMDTHSPMKNDELVPCLMNHSLGPRSIERDQIHPLRRTGAKLTQHRRHLSAMVGSMIDDVLDHVPEDRGSRFPAPHLLFDHAVHSPLSPSLEH